jgi:predicted AAA+ superfamily ATPase
MGAVLETYVVNALDAEYYFREGKKEIDIILKDGKILPVEVKETIDENDIARLSKLLTLVKASRGILVTSSQEGSHGNIQIVPAYAIESLLEIENGPFDYAK